MKTKVGIIGGGQLAQMLAMAANELGLDPIALAPENSPVALVCKTTKHLDDLKETSVTVIESEFSDISLLKQLDKLQPRLSALSLLQDKFEQKQLMKKLGLPTSDFRIIDDENYLEAATQAMGHDLILKWSKFGYDGKGVFFLDPKNFSDATFFIKESKRNLARTYAEVKVRFQKEVALVATFLNEKLIAYPLVETIQSQGICSRVKPISHQGLQMEAERQALKVAESLGLSGVFACEFFLQDSKLILNEIAPRVHNSGHWTQCLPMGSQFHLHWQSLLNLEIPSWKIPAYFEMRNLIGELSTPLNKKPLPVIEKIKPGWTAHWYGKLEERPKRKMGHLNLWAQTAEEFAELVESADKWESRFWKDLRS